MTKNHQLNLLPFHQIEQLIRTGADRFGVRVGQETREVGRMDDSAYIRDIHAGRAVIASLIQQGFFAREREAVFDHILHATHADTWLAYRAERSTRSVLDPRIVERVRELLSHGMGEILVAERGYACTLRRLIRNPW
jgi:hypothetical protein